MHIKTLDIKFYFITLLMYLGVSCNKNDNTSRIKDYANSLGECSDCLKHNLEGFDFKLNYISESQSLLKLDEAKQELKVISVQSQTDVENAYLSDLPHDSIREIKEEYIDFLLSKLKEPDQARLNNLKDSIGFFNRMLNDEFKKIELFKLKSDYNLLFSFVNDAINRQISSSGYKIDPPSLRVYPVELDQDKQLVKLGFSFGWEADLNINQVVIDSTWYNGLLVENPDHVLLSNHFNGNFIRIKELNKGRYKFKGRVILLDLLNQYYYTDFEKDIKAE